MVNAPAPSSLASDLLARRLRELVGEERGILVDFLMHLDEFDRRHAWAEAGYDSLWNYCLRVLHLREGPAGRRIAAMRVLRRFPALEAALRDGRLCLSTVTLVAPHLTVANIDDIVVRAAYRTKAEVEHLVATLQPRAAPKDGVRKLPDRTACAPSEVPLDSLPATTTTSSSPVDHTAPPLSLGADSEERSLALARACVTDLRPTTAPSTATRPTVTPVSADVFSLRVTLDAGLKADLDELTALLSHKVPNGDLAAVLREAIRCAIERHGKRRGSVESKRRSTPEKPSRVSSTAPAANNSRMARGSIPAEVRREVWKRDAGQCTWTAPDGRRCGSRWQLELDHVVPVALGGASTADGLRLLCRTHNQLHAEQVFGADHMARFRRHATWTGEVTHPGMSERVRRESEVCVLFPADTVPCP
jgi:5-methylcytosine-specific restriction endonuclease McrA